MRIPPRLVPAILPALALISASTGCNRGSQPLPPIAPRSALDVPPILNLSSASAEASLAHYVGRRITVTGLWDSQGKSSGYVWSGRDSIGEPIYVESTNDRGLKRETQLENSVADGAPVEVTGVLHLYEPPNSTSPTSQPLPAQSPPRHFYFDPEETEIRLR